MDELKLSSAHEGVGGKILFSDFDGTLYFRDEMEKTRANIEAIRKWRSLGHQFCITTGRSYKSVTTELPQIRELCDCYIVDSGSIVMSKTGELLHVFYFKPEVVSELIEFSKGFSEVPVPFYYTPDSENIDYKTEGVTKLRFWFKDPSLLEEATTRINNSFPVSAIFQEVISNKKELLGLQGFIEIIPLESGKSNAIRFLQGLRGISTDDIITVGDGLNDLGMIRDFNGFAIEGSKLSNIYPELKTVSTVASLTLKMI